MGKYSEQQVELRGQRFDVGGQKTEDRRQQFKVPSSKFQVRTNYGLRFSV
jgi:hypothetical protein